MRHEFYWSARTLRVDVFPEEEAPPITYDVLFKDDIRGIDAVAPYGELIVCLLNEHFRKVDHG